MSFRPWLSIGCPWSGFVFMFEVLSILLHMELWARWVNGFMVNVPESVLGFPVCQPVLFSCVFSVAVVPHQIRKHPCIFCSPWAVCGWSGSDPGLHSRSEEGFCFSVC